ncbi:MAG: diaminopimelate epimerase [Candidatus Hydrothermarchaeota archaeon]
MKFFKYQATGNDFILIDELKGNIVPEEEKAVFAKKVCRRRYSVGGDGVLFLEKSDKADLRMRIFNPDGTEANMCGNGVRCAIKHYLENYSMKKECKVETLSGIIHGSMLKGDKGYRIVVDMGTPKMLRKEIPVKGDPENLFLGENVGGFEVYSINTGVPHSIVFVDSLDVDVKKVGREIRYNPIFPEGTNVDFVKIEGKDRISVRVYERGVEEETFSCGTGATASAIISSFLKKTDRIVNVSLIGGELTIRTVYENEFPVRSYMEGDAELVYIGNLMQ